MPQYKIYLEPIGPYFFGGETMAELGNRQNYYQASKIFPQQTTILGMLRHQLLLHNGLIPVNGANKKRVEELIGASGFEHKNRKIDPHRFGVLRYISPILLNDGSHDYLYRPREWVRVDKKDVLLKLKSVTAPIHRPFLNRRSSQKFIFQKEDSASKRKPYTAKDKFVDALIRSDALVHSDESVPAYRLDDVIQRPEYTGIYKSNREVEERGYFKYKFARFAEEKKDNQIFYPSGLAEFPKTQRESEGGCDGNGRKAPFHMFSIRRGWRFSFFLETNGHVFDPEERIVVMGKEQCLFLMSVEEPNDSPLRNVIRASEVDATKYPGRCKIIIASDTCIKDEQELDRTLVASNTTATHFRYLRSHVKNGHSYNRPDKSVLCQLMQRGSVLYTEDLPKTIELLKHAAFEQIGNNHIVIETLNSNRNKT